MMLLELGDDILRLVVSALTSPFRQMVDALNFAFTCCSVYLIARSVLPKYISITIPSQRYDLLQRTLRQNPDYLRSVHDLDLSFGSVPLIYQHEARAFVNSLLSLKSINIQYNGARLVPILLSPPTISFNKSLQELHLEDNQLTASELLRLLSLFPNLQCFSLLSFSDHTVSVIGDKLNKQVAVQNLEISSLQIVLPLLTEILEHCQRLNNLYCKRPLLAPAIMSFRDITMPLPLSLKAIMPAFPNVAETLSD
jgi:hypothetical protein